MCVRETPVGRILTVQTGQAGYPGSGCCLHSERAAWERRLCLLAVHELEDSHCTKQAVLKAFPESLRLSPANTGASPL